MMNSLTFVTCIFLDILPNIGVTGIIFTIIFPLPKIFFRSLFKNHFAVSSSLNLLVLHLLQSFNT